MGSHDMLRRPPHACSLALRLLPLLLQLQLGLSLGLRLLLLLLQLQLRLSLGLQLQLDFRPAHHVPQLPPFRSHGPPKMYK